MISAMSYFEEKMVGHEPVNYYTFALYAPCCLATFLTEVYGDKYSYNVRISWCLFICAIISSVTPFLADTGNPTLSFWLVYLALVLFGLASGISQCSFYGLAGTMPAKYIGITIMGVSVSGFTNNAFRGLSFALNFETLKENTIFFYAISTVYLLVCSGAFNLILLKHEYFLFYYNKVLTSKGLNN